MPQNPSPKRSYRSERRMSQARQTRRQILESARDLFFEKGYNGATLDAIARDAGVAVETVYATFGSKLAILKALVDVTVVGDDLPVSLLERPHVQAVTRMTDQRQIIHAFASDIYQIMTRMSPIFALLRATAKVDADIDDILSKVISNRLAGMAYFVDQLGRAGPLLPGLRDASVTVWALTSAEMFDLLTRDQGWSKERYLAWLEDILARLLLPE